MVLVNNVTQNTNEWINESSCSKLPLNNEVIICISVNCHEHFSWSGFMCLANCTAMLKPSPQGPRSNHVFWSHLSWWELFSAWEERKHAWMTALKDWGSTPMMSLPGGMNFLNWMGLYSTFIEFQFLLIHLLSKYAKDQREFAITLHLHGP